MQARGPGWRWSVAQARGSLSRPVEALRRLWGQLTVLPAALPWRVAAASRDLRCDPGSTPVALPVAPPGRPQASPGLSEPRPPRRQDREVSAGRERGGRVAPPRCPFDKMQDTSSSCEFCLIPVQRATRSAHLTSSASSRRRIPMMRLGMLRQARYTLPAHWRMVLAPLANECARYDRSRVGERLGGRPQSSACGSGYTMHRSVGPSMRRSSLNPVVSFEFVRLLAGECTSDARHRHKRLR